MKSIRVEIKRNGKPHIEMSEFKEVYKNEKGYRVFEEIETGEINTFYNSASYESMDAPCFFNWLDNLYFKSLVFFVYTEKDTVAALEELKEFIQYCVSKNDLLKNVDYEAITAGAE